MVKRRPVASKYGSSNLPIERYSSKGKTPCFDHGKEGSIPSYLYLAVNWRNNPVANWRGISPVGSNPTQIHACGEIGKHN